MPEKGALHHSHTRKGRDTRQQVPPTTVTQGRRVGSPEGCILPQSQKA